MPERRRTGNPEESQEAAADEETAEADESHYPRVPLDFSSSLLFSDAAFPRLILFSRQGRRSECVMICSVQVKKEKRESTRRSGLTKIFFFFFFFFWPVSRGQTKWRRNMSQLMPIIARRLGPAQTLVRFLVRILH